MRLFVAINFNNKTRSQLLALRDELRSRSERGNFALPENLHLSWAGLREDRPLMELQHEIEHKRVDLYLRL